MYTEAELNQLVATTALMNKAASAVNILERILLDAGTSSGDYKPASMFVTVNTVCGKEHLIAVPERLYRDMLKALVEKYEEDLAQAKVTLLNKF